MSVDTAPVNSIAPLRNVMLLTELIERVQKRREGLPGMATFHGNTGRGKSFAAIYAANKHRAYHVQVKSRWTAKKLCLAILADMGIKPEKAVYDMIEQIAEQLAKSRRPLIVDEADYLIDRGMVEVIRDIYEGSFGAIILIGEEDLPHKLKRWERLHGRMMDWVPAEPGTLADTKHLGRLYCKGVEVQDDLLDAIYRVSSGSVRYICTNLNRVREFAQTRGLAKIGIAEFGDDFFTGNPPGRGN